MLNGLGFMLFWFLVAVTLHIGCSGRICNLLRAIWRDLELGGRARGRDKLILHFFVDGLL